tara:strand:- start:1043 stop:2383 length:1341 start_codon:yes stop_codon:yes gene_type:complete
MNKLNYNLNIINKKYYIDSRDVKEDSAFVCLKGNNNDGHKFINYVLNNFKKTIVIGEKNSKYTKNYRYNKRVILCNSTRKFIKDLAKIKRLVLNDRFFIGVTGSSGKTSLKEILYSILKKYDSTYKSQKSFNNDIGLPFTLLNQNKISRYNIYEVGMNRLGEIDTLSKILKPNLAVITNIGEAHLGKLGSVNNIAKAKSEIIKNVTRNGFIILNKDCKFYEKFKRISKLNKLKILSFGQGTNATISFKIIDLDTLKIKLRNKHFKLKLSNMNFNNIKNILVCILVLDCLNLNINFAKNIFKKIKSVRGRGNLVKIKKKISIIDDSYNSNPISLKNSIYEFHNLKTKKNKILVLGDMFELGKFSKKKHIEIGKYLKLFKFDRIYLVGQKSKQIHNQIKSTFWCKYCKNINVFSKQFKNVLMENSIIMFKASNGVGLNKLLNKKIYKC